MGWGWVTRSDYKMKSDIIILFFLEKVKLHQPRPGLVQGHEYPENSMLLKLFTCSAIILGLDVNFNFMRSSHRWMLVLELEDCDYSYGLVQ